MNRMLFPVMVAGLSMSTLAHAQTEPDGQPGRFATRGECESARKVALRDERMDEEPGRKRGHPDAPRFRCVADPDGGFNLVED
jgi:hypothetical protein